MNRTDFPLLKEGIIYFDNAATTFKPQPVIDKIVEYYEQYSANSHRGDYDIAYKVNQEVTTTRELVRAFINAQTLEEIIFTSGATAGLNLIATGFFKNYLQAGDEILITKSEHASNILPWFKLAQEIGVKIKYIELDDHHYVTMAKVKAAITPRTRVISLAEVTNVIGDQRPIKAICTYAHEHHILVVVDGAQSVPHLKVDVQDLGADFLVFSAHKMMGPTGVGVLYGRQALLEKMIPFEVGGGSTESFTNENEVYYKDIPFRLEAGTANLAGIIGFGASIRYLNQIGMTQIAKRENELRQYLINELIKIPHLDILNLESDVGIVSFNVEGIFSQDVAYYLNKYGICVRAGDHCAKILKDQVKVTNSIRISLYYYNTETEIDTVVELLKDKAKILRELI